MMFREKVIDNQTFKNWSNLMGCKIDLAGLGHI